MVLTLTNESEVGQVLEKLKNKKSSGHDDLSNEKLKCCSPMIEKYLTEIMSTVIEERKFPSVLQIAIVKALYEKGDNNNTENYRPICVIGKVYEKLLYRLMYNFLR